MPDRARRLPFSSQLLVLPLPISAPSRTLRWNEADFRFWSAKWKNTLPTLRGRLT